MPQSDVVNVDVDCYEARHGPTPLLVLAALAFLAAGLVLPDLPILLRIGVLVLGAGGAWVTLSALIRRGLAFKVDAAGVTLGAIPDALIRSHEVFVPWSDIDAIVLWAQSNGYTKMRYIGLQRRDGLPPLPGSLTGRTGRALIRMFSPVPEQVAQASRPATTWRLDTRGGRQIRPGRRDRRPVVTGIGDKTRNQARAGSRIWS